MSRFKSENAYGNWSHPRGANGRFVPKLSQSLRGSSRSVSYNAGARIPIVPGRLNLYAGALIRVERSSNRPGLLSGAADKVLDGIVTGTGNRDGVRKAADLLKTGEVEINGIRIQRSAIINSPTVRVSGAKKRQQTPSTISGLPQSKRAPNRKPRTRSQRRISERATRPKTISR